MQGSDIFSDDTDIGERGKLGMLRGFRFQVSGFRFRV